VNLYAALNPLKRQIDGNTRFFWVTKKQVKAKKYDLSASRYRKFNRMTCFTKIHG
jgi:hypothetical protein